MQHAAGVQLRAADFRSNHRRAGLDLTRIFRARISDVDTAVVACRAGARTAADHRGVHGGGVTLHLAVGGQNRELDVFTRISSRNGVVTRFTTGRHDAATRHAARRGVFCAPGVE